MDVLIDFFKEIKIISFWQRVFKWNKIQKLSYDANNEFEFLKKEILELREIKIRNEELEKRMAELEKKDFSDRTKMEHQLQQIQNLQRELTELKSNDEEKEKRYNDKVAHLNQASQDLKNRQQKIEDDRVLEKEAHFDKMKKQWAEHEKNVNENIKLICQKHTINHLDKSPFERLKPDNIIEIADEYIIFDAKSPANDNLQNFPTYIKTQTEQLKKYASLNNVKKDIFLVIPSNAIHTITQTAYNMGSYNVFIITSDSLEPIILSLQKIEEYEFADKLSPDERDNICRIIGKFAHTTKRKIQIDQFFANHFIELLIKCKNDLPEDILKNVIEFEKAEKLNAPTERRNNQILTSDLQKKNEKINSEANIRGITIPPNFEELKKLK